MVDAIDLTDAPRSVTVHGVILEPGEPAGAIFELIMMPTPADRVAVVFGGWGEIGMGRTMLTQAALLDAGYDVLAVRPHDNVWYQDVSEHAVAAIAAQLPDYKERFVLGAGMGAYAALTFSAALGADRVLALSPVFSVDPAVASWEDRWPAMAADVTHRPMADILHDTDAVIDIVYDPQTLDGRHATLLKEADPRVVLHPLRYVDAPVSMMLAEAGLLDAAVLDIAAGRGFPPHATVRTARRQSALYLKMLARAAGRRGHPVAAGRLFEMALERRRAPDILLAYGQFLAEQRRPAAALPVIGEAVRLSPPDPHWIAFRAHLEELVGDLSAAADSFALAAQLDPATPEFRAAESKVLRSLVALNQGLAPATGANRSAFDELDRLKKGPEVGHLHLRSVFGGLAVSLGIVFVFWVMAGIFEWR